MQNAVPHGSPDKRRCATCKTVWEPEKCGECKGTGRVNRSRRAVEVAEGYADGTIPHLRDWPGEAGPLAWLGLLDAAGAAAWATTHSGCPAATQAALLRCICGNPWRPVALPVCQRCEGDGKAHGSDRPFEWTGPGTYPGPCPVCDGFKYVKPLWLTDTVTKIARQIYADRAFDLLPVLADALLDAGCEDEAILNHCRGRDPGPLGFEGSDHTITVQRLCGPHARGCWVLDLLLGKS